MKFLSIYWSLFWTETQLAISKFGLKTAIISSPGFLMNSVVGVLLSGAFIQLAIFSFLIRTIGGVRSAPEYEQLIIEKRDDNNEDFDFQASVDERIDNVQKLRKAGLYAIRVPRHFPFTSVLKKLALHQIKFNLLSISNQIDQIQVEITINNNNEKRLLWLKQRSNVDVVFEYKSPTDKTQTTIYIRVNIEHLFSFIRECAEFEVENSLTIVQVFDYYE